jgi:hypothetical protein
MKKETLKKITIILILIACCEYAYGIIFIEPATFSACAAVPLVAIIVKRIKRHFKSKDGKILARNKTADKEYVARPF